MLLNLHYKILELKNFQIESSIADQNDLKILLKNLKRIQWGEKEFNTNFGKSGEGYADQKSVTKYKRNPENLKRFFKDFDEDDIKELRDAFAGLDHKLSGCNKFLESIGAEIQLFKQEILKDKMSRKGFDSKDPKAISNLDALMKELNSDIQKGLKEEFDSEFKRIQTDIVKVADEWQALMYDASDLLDEMSYKDSTDPRGFREDENSIGKYMDKYDHKLVKTQEILPKLKKILTASSKVNPWVKLIKNLQMF